MERECLLIFWLTVHAAGLKCYFCKGDYVSEDDKEEHYTKDIPHCGTEPYEGNEEHVVVCDVYYDNFKMVYPSFRKALSSTEQVQRAEKRDVTQKNSTFHDANGYDEPPDTSMKPRSYRDVYPYSLYHAPWGSQRVHPRVKPYLCLTVHTINSTFPSRVCGMRYFMDCPLLFELTSEPLEPSSFITDCHQCNGDYCNAASQQNISFENTVLVILGAIHSFCVVNV